MKLSYKGMALFVAAALAVPGVSSVNAATAGTSLSAGVSAAVSTILAANDTAVVSEDEAVPTSSMVLYYGYTNLGVADVENYLNVREAATEEADLVGKMPVNAGCEIVGEENGWYQIESGDVSGYVKADYLLTGDAARAKADEVAKTVATVKTQTLNVRNEATTDSPIIVQVGDSEKLEVLEQEDGWTKVAVDDMEGYVSNDYVTISVELEDALTMTEVKYGEGVSDVRVDLVANALQYVGHRYVWGGTSLANGVDCSGFTMQIMAQYGIYLPHSSAAQPAYGTRINAADAQPGDLFFYGNGSSINHVAIYIGGGQIVHASSAKTGIKISNAYYRTPICVVSYL